MKRNYRKGSRALYGWLTAGCVTTTTLAPSLVSAQRDALLWPNTIASVPQRLKSEVPALRQRALKDLKRLPKSALLRMLPEFLRSENLDVRLAAARACRRVRARNMGQYFVDWLSEPNSELRLAAATHLREFSSPAAGPALIRALRDPEAAIARVVAQALGQLGSPTAVSALLGELSNRNGKVRHAIAQALARIGDVRAVMPLMGLLADPVPEVRRQVASALSVLGDARSVGGLLTLLDDSDSNVRAEAARGLGSMRYSDAVPAIRELLATDTSRLVLQAALGALGQMRTPEALGVLVDQLGSTNQLSDRAIAVLASAGQDALPSLRQCVLSETQPLIVSACLETLGSIEGDESSALLLQALAAGRGPPAIVLDSLSGVGGQDALPAVLDHLGSDDPIVRKASLRATALLLQRAGRGGTAVEPLLLALKKAAGERNQQLVLLRLLGLTGSHRALGVVQQYAKSTDEGIQTVAAEALGALGLAQSDTILLKLLHSGNHRVAWAAALSLRRAGGPQTVDILLARLTAVPLRQAIFSAIALIGPLSRGATNSQRSLILRTIHTAPGPLVDVLIEGLGLTPGPAGLRLLSQLGASADPAVRAKVAELLAHHMDSAAVLRLLLNDPDDRVRANAVWSMGIVGTAKDIVAIDSRLSDSSWPVSSNAVAASARLRQAIGNTSVGPWCEILKGDRSHRVANALTALSATKTSCPDGDAQWLLHHHASTQVRSNAAEYLAQLPGLDSTAHLNSLRHCAEADLDGEVAQRCSQLLRKKMHLKPRRIAKHFTPPDSLQKPHNGARLPLSILIVQPGTQNASPRMAFALRESTGWIRNGWSDRRGSLLAVGLSQGTTVQILAPTFLDPF